MLGYDISLFAWANPGLFLFIFVLFTLQLKFKLKTRSVDVLLAWDSNPGHRMEGEDGSIELLITISYKGTRNISRALEWAKAG